MYRVDPWFDRLDALCSFPTRRSADLPADGEGWERFDGAVLSGPRSRHHLIETPGRSPLAGNHFRPGGLRPRSEEHTSELQSRPHLVCRLLLDKKRQTIALTFNTISSR